jgi:hypothetical protein
MSVAFALLLAAAPAPSAPPPAAATPAAVADPARLAAARALVRVQGTSATLEKMFRSLAPAMSLSVVGALTNSADGKAFLAMIESRGEDAQTRLMQLVAEEYLAAMLRRVPTMTDRIAADYAQRFTQAELDDALAFFASPSGKRFVELQPELQERGRQIGMELGADAGREAMEAALKRFDAHDKPAAAHPGT